MNITKITKRDKRLGMDVPQLHWALNDLAAAESKLPGDFGPAGQVCA
ncbi:MAG: hypothetical protein LBG05_09005 [Treponema sp.]|jgi:hypothetical protein|nr:hypothetical protein [Treponema sp.]